MKQHKCLFNEAGSQFASHAFIALALILGLVLLLSLDVGQDDRVVTPNDLLESWLKVALF